MRKLLAGATIVVFGAGAMSSASAQLLMKGSDTLEDVTKGVLADCIVATNDPTILATTDITYVGGGSTGGQAALVAGLQRIGPMSRPMNGTACPVTTPPQGTLDARGEQLLIGLDGISMTTSNQAHRDSLNNATGGDCADTINGLTLPYALITPSPRPVPEVCFLDPALGGLPNCCLNHTTGANDANCNADGSYTFRDWKDVLALLYAGQNNSANAALTAAFPKTRQINRINCASQVRKALADNWGDLFDTDCSKGPVVGNCKKLKHAFRRGDLSGTTDTFVTLVGLAVAVPAYTTTFLPNPIGIPTVNPASATANPFCNAGIAAMNKGDSDYLDLDPIRRIADATSAGGVRTGLEQVAEGYNAPSAAPGTPGVDTRPDPTAAEALVELPEFGAPHRSNVGPNQAITAPAPNDFTTLQKAAIAQRKGLGLVLPIGFPTNYQDEGVAYWSPSAAPGQAPVICTAGSFAPTIPVAPAGMCPDGTNAPCLFPVNVKCSDGSAPPCVAPATTVLNFNCMVATATPVKPPLKDNRVYNLMVVNAAGKYVLDGYTNPSLGTSLTVAKQNRVVSAFYRLHVSQVDNFGGPIPTPNSFTVGTSVCKTFDETTQIGCLTKASPCSIGYAGRESVDKAPGSNNMAYRLGTTAPGVAATDTNIQALLDTTNPSFYPMTRKLFVNHWVDPALAVLPTMAKEEVLYNCFKQDAITSPRVAQFHFLPIPATTAFPAPGPHVDNSCPNPR